MEHAGDSEIAREDRLVTEEPLEIRVRVGQLEPRRAWVTMRTPGHDFELAAGWLVNEGLATPGTLDQVAYCTDADLDPEQEFNVVTVTLGGATEVPHRHVAASAGSSACGVCGKDSVSEALQVRSGGAVVGRAPRRGRRTPAAGGAARAAGAVRPHRRGPRRRPRDRRRDAARRARGRRSAQRRRQGRRRAGARGRVPGCRLPGAQRPRRVRARAEGRGQRDRVDRRPSARRPASPRGWPGRPGSSSGGSRRRVVR